jgi:hypothetical protein
MTPAAITWRQGFQPRGLSRVEAAAYVGVSPTKFDGLVRDGRMPAPTRLDRRKVWDRLALDQAFSLLSGDFESNTWDAP